jgi:hypothetical protein
VNSYSDLVIGAELQREGRKIRQIRFALKERDKKRRIGSSKSLSQAVNHKEEGLLNRLIERYEFSKEQAEQLLIKYPEPMILEKMGLIEQSRNFKEGKVQNRTAYLISALRHNYQESRSTTAKGVKIKKERRKAALNGLVEEILSDYQKFRIQFIDQTFEQLAKIDKEVFMNKFYSYAELAINTVLELQRNKYTRATILSSPQIKAIFRQYIEQELLVPEQLSLDNYVNRLPQEKREVWYSSLNES